MTTLGCNSSPVCSCYMRYCDESNLKSQWLVWMMRPLCQWSSIITTILHVWSNFIAILSRQEEKIVNSIREAHSQVSTGLCTNKTPSSGGSESISPKLQSTRKISGPFPGTSPWRSSLKQPMAIWLQRNAWGKGKNRHLPQMGENGATISKVMNHLEIIPSFSRQLKKLSVGLSATKITPCDVMRVGRWVDPHQSKLPNLPLKRDWKKTKCSSSNLKTSPYTGIIS